jgi:hypothetical protein
MMGTLAAALASKQIDTSADRYWTEVEGDIENVERILKITRIRVRYHLKVSGNVEKDAREAFSSYLPRCPAAQSVIGCIAIEDVLDIEQTG